MPQAAMLTWLLVGASLLGVALRVTIPPTAWLGLIGLLHASRAMRPTPSLLLVWLTLWGTLVIVRREFMPIPGVAFFVIMGLEAVVMTLPFAADRLAGVRLGGVASTLVFPMALVSIEFLRSRFLPGATWGSIAYTQYRNLPLMQIAAFVGIWGITFLIGWAASTFDMAWSRNFDLNLVRTPVLTCVGVLGVVFVGGSIRLAFAPTDRASIRTAMINRPVDLFAPGEMTQIAEGRVSTDERPRLAEKLTRLHDWFLDGSRREARAGARFIAWPEQNLLIFKEDEPAFLARAQRLAGDEQIYLGMGLGTVHVGDKQPFENKLILIDPSGRILVSYLKTHPVPGWEAGIMRPGDGRVPVVATRDARMAAAVCYDADFPEFIRQAGQAHADVLLVPANEWKAIKNIHVQMAAFRAIENGVSLVRPAASGLSSAFDPWGRVLAVGDFFSVSDRTVTAQVPLGGVGTLYARTGDLFAWLCVTGVVGAIAIATRVGA
jgi:apolipoprotein N-acyltransferase